jgi:hypothetical protein
MLSDLGSEQSSISGHIGAKVGIKTEILWRLIEETRKHRPSLIAKPFSLPYAKKPPSLETIFSNPRSNFVLFWPVRRLPRRNWNCDLL